MSGVPAARFILDAGAFFAWERGDMRIRALVDLGLAGKVELRTSSGVVGQIWRGGPRQARLAKLLNGELVDERPLDPSAARNVGLLAARTGLKDVVDGHVAALALAARAKVVTSDPDDILGWGVAAEDLLRC